MFFSLFIGPCNRHQYLFKNSVSLSKETLYLYDHSQFPSPRSLETTKVLPASGLTVHVNVSYMWPFVFGFFSLSMMFSKSACVTASIIRHSFLLPDNICHVETKYTAFYRQWIAFPFWLLGVVLLWASTHKTQSNYATVIKSCSDSLWPKEQDPVSSVGDTRPSLSGPSSFSFSCLSSKLYLKSPGHFVHSVGLYGSARVSPEHFVPTPSSSSHIGFCFCFLSRGSYSSSTFQLSYCCYREPTRDDY